MANTVFGIKQRMTEAYLGETRTPVTKIDLFPMTVAHVKSIEKDGYIAAQVVFGKGKKNVTKSMAGHLKKSGVKTGKLREIRIDDAKNVGDTMNPSDTVSAGSVLTVVGTSKGKGFAGGVKRWGFAGGPRTHGQSDRHRAPGSIGQGTTPGRVHRGKKMAGRMGSDTISIKNIQVVAVMGNSIWVTGPVPGATGSLIRVTVTGQKDAPALTFLNGYEAKKDTPQADQVSESNEAAASVDESKSEAIETESAEADSEKANV